MLLVLDLVVFGEVKVEVEVKVELVVRGVMMPILRRMYVLVMAEVYYLEVAFEGFEVFEV